MGKIAGLKTVATGWAVAVLVFLSGAQLAFAHPHVWVVIKSEVIMDGNKVAAVRHHWTFDEAFSAFASQGLDENKDGKLSRAELQPLAQVNVESLSEYYYFSDLYEKGAPDNLEKLFGEPEDYFLTTKNGQLILHFTLPVVIDVDASKVAYLDIFDPTYFVDFIFAKTAPAKLVNAPKGCSMDTRLPQGMDDTVLDQLAQIPADQREIPAELMQFTSAMANRVIISCK